MTGLRGGEQEGERSQGPGFQLPVNGSVPETEGTGDLRMRC